MFTFCQNLIVAGRVEGNIIGIALRASISGEISENVYLLGIEFTHTGVIEGDLHYSGIVLTLQSPDSSIHHPIDGQLIFATLSVLIDDTVAIDGRITGVGYQLLINALRKSFVCNHTISKCVKYTHF